MKTSNDPLQILEQGHSNKGDYYRQLLQKNKALDLQITSKYSKPDTELFYTDPIENECPDSPDT